MAVAEARRRPIPAKDRSEAIDHAGRTESQEAIANSGLCSTCANMTMCMHAGNAEHPVLECEEFTRHQTDLRASAPRRLNLAGPPQPHGNDASALLAKGLCGNCENRADCTFAKPEGGVWRCEEYR